MSDDELTRLDDLHRVFDGPIPAGRRAPRVPPDPSALLSRHEAERFRETVRAVVARRARLGAADPRRDRRLAALVDRAAGHRNRALPPRQD